MNHLPKLSVILPVYNVPERFYRACLQSLFIQKIDDVEFIIVNDGSTRPYCEEIAKEYLAKDVRFRYFYKDNGGVSSARNLGIEHSRGEYLMFVDADDVISPDCCEYVMRDVEEARYDCVIYRFLWSRDVFPTEQPVQRKELSKDEVRTAIFKVMGIRTDSLISHFSWGGPFAKIFRRGAVESRGIRFNEKLKIWEDFLFCMEFYQNFPSIVLDNRYVYGYNINNNESICRKPSDVIARELPAAVEAFSEFIEKYHLFGVEYAYFLRKKGVSSFAVAREYSRFLSTPVLQKYLRLLLKDTRMSYKEWLAVLVRSTYLSLPYMMLNRKRIKVNG
jgi:glycosyltransferase involved in cell wall biosynthesis